MIYQAFFNVKNEKLIFDQIGILFALNLICCSVWFYFFNQNSRNGFIISFLLQVVVLYSVVKILLYTLADVDNLNLCEYLSLRIGFSVYSAWITYGTVLNACFVLKSMGFENEKEANDDAYEKSPPKMEEFWGILMLWVTAAIFGLFTYNENDPIFGFIFIFLLVAIKAKQADSAKM